MLPPNSSSIVNMAHYYGFFDIDKFGGKNSGKKFHIQLTVCFLKRIVCSTVGVLVFLFGPWKHCLQINIEQLFIGGVPCGSVVKNPPANAGATGDTGSIPGSGRSPGEGNGNSLQYSCLENPTAEEPGGLQSMGSQRVGHGWVTKQQQSQSPRLQDEGRRRTSRQGCCEN